MWIYVRWWQSCQDNHHGTRTSLWITRHVCVHIMPFYCARLITRNPGDQIVCMHHFFNKVNNEWLIKIKKRLDKSTLSLTVWICIKFYFKKRDHFQLVAILYLLVYQPELPKGASVQATNQPGWSIESGSWHTYAWRSGHLFTLWCVRSFAAWSVRPSVHDY